LVAADDRQVLMQALLQTVRDALGYVVPTTDSRAPPQPTCTKRPVSTSNPTSRGFGTGKRLARSSRWRSISSCWACAVATVR
jgi:hypothetical protein